ncbi:D-glycerate dehydrogenase [Candidatus Thorarchaeota archaeon]|nr:MAG: D-glycerate dehydrogenase [Candidatus Thorarchaeota archaeon]
MVYLKRVFVTRKIPEKGIELLREHFHIKVWRERRAPIKEEIVQEAAGFQGLVTLLSDPIDGELISSLPQLQAICQYAVGYDNIDVDRATERGIIITNTPGVLTETTADLTWALIMATCRRVVEGDRYVRRGEWQVAWGPKLLLGTDVYGSTLGIVGLGRIGSAVARRSLGFNMKVLYHNRSSNDRTKAIEDEIGAKRVSLEELLSESDIVTLHVPLNESTEGLIGQRELKMMKKGAVLVNTSRGAVIDEGALISALKSGHLQAAGLDVFQQEPVEQDNELIRLPNTVVLPHIGSASYATRNRMSVMCAENMIAALSGDEPPNVLNPEVLKQSST